jgi:hypothetical protein
MGDQGQPSIGEALQRPDAQGSSLETPKARRFTLAGLQLPTRADVTGGAASWATRKGRPGSFNSRPRDHTSNRYQADSR